MKHDTELMFNTGETVKTLKAEYNPENSVLRKCQLRMVEMLCYFDSVCKTLEIKYRLDCGSVLGAVRHQGFIPWDDDIDIIIDKKDEKILCDYLIQHPHHQFVLQSHKTDSQYYYPWNTLRDLKSEYLQESTLHNVRKYRGLQIDIFTEQRGGFKPLFLFAAKMTALNNRFFLGKFKFAHSAIFYIQARLVIPFFSLISKIFGNKKKCNFSYGIFWWFPIFEDDLYPTEQLKFEGLFFPGPAKPEKYLEILYGKNFMDLPLKEKRKVHEASYRIED